MGKLTSATCSPAMRAYFIAGIPSVSPVIKTIRSTALDCEKVAISRRMKKRPGAVNPLLLLVFSPNQLAISSLMPYISCQSWQQFFPFGTIDMHPLRKLAIPLRRRREFTTAEASTVTGISVAKINHCVARELASLGVTIWGDGKRRLLGHDALVALRVADDFPKSLTPNARIDVIRETLAHPSRKDIVLPDKISVPVSISRKHVANGLLRLQQATSAIVSDAGILQGAPCFKGTRIPVHVVAEIAAANGVDAAKTTYSRLTRGQIELACIYAKAYPQRGRPRCAGDVLGKRKPKSSRTISVMLD
jgi:uncharacterized protein (DUF433 family)